MKLSRKAFWTIIAAIMFVITHPLTVMAAQPAEGFDPADGMYVKAESEYYWEGRYSNDRVFSEYMAKELTGDYENLVNYAVGGAFTGVLTGTDGEADERSNWSPWLKGWSGVHQTEKFLEDVNGQADPDALYIISIGGNDAYAVEDLGVERTAELSSDYALEMVRNLVEAGAKYILLPNRYVDDRENLTSFADIRNQQVVQKIEAYLALDTTPDDVVVIYGNSQRLRENIEEQGFEAFGYKSMGFYLISDWVPAYGYALASEDNSDLLPTHAAEDIYHYGYYYSTDSKYYAPEAAGWEPDDFYTYDEYHLSGRSHKHLAAYLLNSDIRTEDGIFKKVYNGEISEFAAAMEDGTIPSKYTKVYTFGDSSIDSGRAFAVTTELVESREKPSVSVADLMDVKRDAWYTTYVNYVLQTGLLDEADPGIFAPEESITRAQFITMLGRADGIEDASESNPAEPIFADVPVDAPYAAHAAAAVKKGYIDPDSDASFSPNEVISREEMARILGIYAEVNGIALPEAGEYRFADDESIADSAKESVYRLHAAGILTGVGNDRFDPLGETTRAAAAKVISILLNY